MMDADAAHRVLRIVHAAVGFVGLGLFWIPVCARKGSRLHVVSGRLFAWCACFVGVTGLLSSAWGVAHPSSFLPNAELVGLTEEQARVAFADLRFLLSITGFLALGVLAGVALGVGVVRAGERHERLRHPILVVLLAGFLLWSGALALHGGASLAASYGGWSSVPDAGAGRHWIPALLGVVGVYGAVGDLRYVYGPRPAPSERQSIHVHCMIGAGAGFYAAFFLFGATRVLALPGLWQLIAPLAPLLIGEVATKVWSGRFERKLEPPSRHPERDA